MQRILAPLAIGLAGAAILVWLGTWQVQRLAWKRGILNEIETTIAGPARPLPDQPDAEAQRYRPVALQGRFDDQTLRVLVSVKRQGAGWRLISPFTTEDGRRILLDRGFLPVAEDIAAPPQGAVEIAGNLHWPDDRNSSTPENAPATNTWYARDIDQMSQRLQTEPLLVIARSVTPPEPDVRPLPVDTSGIPNDHLQYAITWFSLAAVWLLMTGVWIRRRLTGKET
ncbi:SURF1 family protein [Pseudoponticoccus marisrubri]|uniref:SURF1-like protein n=1 Tax=Pseudoponticoccus marisrubri TaxID=1685382 RepID=A0A0W7WDX7_9RHOB|nr:SURF1 family protein [Pseudoponticoccus marisrubri]KUF08774.1 cytochrome oxidase biogenesis protein Surf1, facilitates heme A insertion [Pseudoponticoccus marisrubri]